MSFLFIFDLTLQINKKFLLISQSERKTEYWFLFLFIFSTLLLLLSLLLFAVCDTGRFSGVKWLCCSLKHCGVFFFLISRITLQTHWIGSHQECGSQCCTREGRWAPGCPVGAGCARDAGHQLWVRTGWVWGGRVGFWGSEQWCWNRCWGSR